MARTAPILMALTLTVPSIAPGEDATDPARLRPLDIFELEWADSPAVSPDGRFVVYQRNHFDVQNDRRRSHLWMVDLERDTHRPLTTGAEGDGAPVWSPTGDRLAWVNAREGSAQIWVRWMDSGQSAQLTQLAEAPSALRWSPDGRRLAFVMRVPAETEPLATLPTAPEGAEWAPGAKLVDRLIYRFDGAGYVDPGYDHVFVLPAEGGTPRQVTRGDFDHAAPVWSADGESLYVVSNHREDWEYDPVESDLYRVDVATGESEALTTRDGPDGSPALSPDGSTLAYLGFDDRKLGYQQSGLYLLDLVAGASRRVAAEADLDFTAVAWDESGRGLYVLYERQGRNRIGHVPAAGGELREVVGDVGGTAMGRPYTSGAFDARGGTLAFTQARSDRPAELAVLRGDDAARTLTSLNEDALAHTELGAVEELWVASRADQRDIHAWLIKPPGFDPDRRYPLILEIHGGPYAGYGPDFSPELQLYAAAGYVVLYVNPRGSTGYGQGFADLIQHRYPGEDFDDLMSAVDAVLERGFVDPERLFVTGGSGGGVLTAWIVGHTDRFAAAAVVKPVINWTSFALTADAYTFFSEYWFAKRPWEDQEAYWKRSPLAYVADVSTPTLLMTGEADYRTPISETEQFYQALKLRKVETAMVRIPEASHGIARRPSHLLAKALNILGWFERHDPGAAGAPESAAESPAD
jgi:acylaminoacyl-peptidase